MEGAGVADITRTIRGERYHLNANSFFQTNLDLVPALIDSALGDARGETAIELIRRRVVHRAALSSIHERDRGGRRCCGQRLRAPESCDAGLSNAEVVNEDVADWLEIWSAAAERSADAALDRLKSP